MKDIHAVQTLTLKTEIMRFVYVFINELSVKLSKHEHFRIQQNVPEI